MIWWKKTKAWCLAHWRWLVFSVASIIAVIVGYSKSREFKQSAHAAKENFEKEREIIESTGKEHIRSITAHGEAQDKAHEENVLSFEKKKGALRKEKLRRLLDESETDPKAIDEFLNEMGIDEG